jgi:hypothetical protein
MREIILDQKDSGILEGLDLVALVIRNQGKYEKAEEMNRRALEENEKKLEVEYPSTFNSISNLASVL